MLQCISVKNKTTPKMVIKTKRSNCMQRREMFQASGWFAFSFKFRFAFILTIVFVIVIAINYIVLWWSALTIAIARRPMTSAANY